MAIRDYLSQLMEARQSLSQSEASSLMREILAGAASELEIAAMLGAMGARGVTAEELAGFAEGMRAVARSLDLGDTERATLVDTCGTGGDASGSFNISTGAALVAAAAGAQVAKHGNRAVTSQCGSADVLEALGIATHLTQHEAAEALRRDGFCFLLAPSHHPAMRAVLPVRRALGVRTAFHVLGPLLNPAGAQRQVMGVYDERLVGTAAEALAHLGTKHALVVHGTGGMDELSISGTTKAAEVRDGAVHRWEVQPEPLGLTRAPLDWLQGGNAAENAAILEALLTGADEAGPVRARREVVLLNAGAVLLVAGLAESLMGGIDLAREAVDTGEARDLLGQLRRANLASTGSG